MSYLYVFIYLMNPCKVSLQLSCAVWQSVEMMEECGRCSLRFQSLNLGDIAAAGFVLVTTLIKLSSCPVPK